MTSFDFRKHSHFIPPTDPAKREQWLLDHEERIAKEVRSVLGKAIRQASKDFISTLTATGDLLMFDKVLNQFTDYVDKTLVPQLQGIFLGGALNAWILAPESDNIPSDVSVWPDVMNEAAVEYSLQATNRMKNTADDIWTQIKLVTMNTLTKGASIEEMKNTLQKEINYSEFRADTIARTEVLNAFNNGDWQGNLALGPAGPTHKQWIATPDNRARTNHVAVNGMVLPINEPFIVGGEPMMFPHAPGTSAKNAVNCRCVLGYLYDDDPLVQNATQQFTPVAPQTPQPVKAAPSTQVTGTKLEKIEEAKKAPKAPKAPKAEAAPMSPMPGQPKAPTTPKPQSPSQKAKIAKAKKEADEWKAAVQKAVDEQKKLPEGAKPLKVTMKKVQPPWETPAPTAPKAPTVAPAPTMKAPTPTIVSQKPPIKATTDPSMLTPDVDGKPLTIHPRSSDRVRDFSMKDSGSPRALDRDYDDWRGSLTEAETRAIRSYTGSGYSSMNAALRTDAGVAGNYSQMTPAMRRKVNTADGALNRAVIQEDIIVVRGVSDSNDLIKSLPEGSVFHDPGFQSTAASSQGFGREVQMRIFVPKGSKGAYLGEGRHSTYGHRESEVLLPPGATYRIVGKSTYRTAFRTRTILDVELISQGNPPPAGTVVSVKR